MSGENRAWAVAEAPSGSTTGFRAPPDALTCVGRAVPLAPRSVPFGIPRTVHALAEVFLTVSAYAIWPAPALFGITANVAARSVPRQGLADFTDPVVVTVSVEVIVCVCGDGLRGAAEAAGGGQPDCGEDQSRSSASSSHARTPLIGSRSCASESRSRTVTVSSSSVCSSTVKAHGVPISSCRR